MWFRYFFVATLILALLQSSVGEQDARIVGGETVTISSVPYLIQLYVDSAFTCGGSLVNTKFVVTAAHCVKGLKASQVTVKGGATYLTGTGVTRSVKRIIVPSSYSASTLNMDVAVLQLSSALTGTNIKTIPLCTTTVPTGATVKVSGWGSTSESGSTSNQVQSVELKRISKSTCQSSYKGQDQLTSTMMCASKSGKDSCYGDSGGPLVYNSQLCGIVSWGIGCARTYPGVYTDVKVVTPFIKKAINTYS